MCDIGTVFGVLSSVVGFISDSQNAKDEERFRRAQAEANRVSAENAARIQADQVNQGEAQEAIKSAQQISEVRKDALQARARARVAAGEAGVAGISVDALQRDFGAQEGRFVDATRQNLEFAAAQNRNSIEAIRNKAAGRIIATRAKPVSKPSFFGAALRIGGQVAGSKSFQKLVGGSVSTSTFAGGTSVQRTQRSLRTFSISS